MLRQSTLVFLVTDTHILLAPKKKRLWTGRYNGYGGRVEEGEDVITTAIREVREESDGVIVAPADLQKVAVVTVHNENDDAWEMHVYFTTHWQGEPKESDEMGEPKWFARNALPKDSLPIGDYEWLALLVAGRRGRATMHRSADKMSVTNFNWEEPLEP